MFLPCGKTAGKVRKGASSAEAGPETEVYAPAVAPISREGGHVVARTVLAPLHIEGVGDVVHVQEQHQGIAAESAIQRGI